MRRVICLGFVLWAMACLSGLLLCADEPTESIVIITTERGGGTGFICAMGGTNYIVTNTHVLEGAQRYDFRTLNQNHLTGLSLELADDRDLARIRLDKTPVPALAVAGGLPKIGEKITVLGNSEGMDAVTRLEGAVDGLGPNVVEVNAKFVSGNSGSPILNASGGVVAVATFVTRPGFTNWVNQGTRFSQVRRFGVRLDAPVWVPINPRLFYQESTVLRDFETFLRDSATMMNLLNHHDLEKLSLFGVSQKSDDTSRYFDSQYPNQIAAFCSNLKRANEAVRSGLDKRSGSASVSLHMALTGFRRFPELPLSKLRQARWSTRFYRDSAQDYEKTFTQWKKSNDAQSW